MSEGLTLAQFIALASLNVAIIGLVIAQLRRSSDVHERIARLEAELKHHLENGARHER